MIYSKPPAMSTSIRALCFTLIFLTLWSKPCQSQLYLDRIVQIITAGQDFNESFERIQQVEAFLKKVEAGEKPEVNFTVHWNDLITQLRGRAAKIRATPILHDFDRSAYAISLEDLNDCNKKTINFEKLEKYRKEFDNEVFLDKANLKSFDILIAKLETNLAGLEEFSKLCIKYAEIPGYSAILPDEILDIQLKVKPAVADVISAVSGQKRKLQQEIPKMETSLSNLDGNIQLLKSMLCQTKTPDVPSKETSSDPPPTKPRLELSCVETMAKDLIQSFPDQTYSSLEYSLKINDGIVKFRTIGHLWSGRTTDVIETFNLSNFKEVYVRRTKHYNADKEMSYFSFGSCSKCVYREQPGTPVYMNSSMIWICASQEQQLVDFLTKAGLRII